MHQGCHAPGIGVPHVCRLVAEGTNNVSQAVTASIHHSRPSFFVGLAAICLMHEHVAKSLWSTTMQNSQNKRGLAVNVSNIGIRVVLQ